jgi:hypothetical protein
MADRSTWRVIIGGGGPPGNARGRLCGRCFAGALAIPASNAQVCRELLVGGFKTSAFILVCLHAVLESFDGLVLNGEPSSIIDSAFGVITVLTLQGKDAILEPRVISAEALGQLLAFVDPGAGDDRATRSHDQNEDQDVPGPI